MNQKEQILSGTETLFRRYGIKSVTMDDIARHLGISKKTLYQFVENKADLIDQIMTLHLEQEKVMVEEIHEKSVDAIDEILAIARHVIQQLRELSPSLMYDLQKYYKSNWDQMMQLHQVYIYDIIKGNIERGIKEGFYREDLNADIIAKLYVGKTMIVVDEDLFPLKNYNKENLFKEYIRYHIHGIASVKGLALFEKHVAEKINIELKP